MIVRWIKCSEKLPEKSGKYLTVRHSYHGKPYLNYYVTVTNFSTDLSEVDEMAFGPHHVSGWYDISPDFYNEDYTYSDAIVVYWMPFPDPPDE